MGETATFDGKSITVTDVQRNYDTGNQFAQPESGKEFVIVTVQITNNSDSTLDYNTFEFKMQDSNGVQQSEAITALSEGKLNSGSLAKGGKVTGKLAYEVPKDDAGFEALYQNFSFSITRLSHSTCNSRRIAGRTPAVIGGFLCSMTRFKTYLSVVGHKHVPMPLITEMRTLKLKYEDVENCRRT